MRVLGGVGEASSSHFCISGYGVSSSLLDQIAPSDRDQPGSGEKGCGFQRIVGEMHRRPRSKSLVERLPPKRRRMQNGRILDEPAMYLDVIAANGDRDG